MKAILILLSFLLVALSPKLTQAQSDLGLGKLKIAYSTLHSISLQLVENESKLENVIKELSIIPTMRKDKTEMLTIMGILGIFREMLVMIHYEYMLIGTTISIKEDHLVDFSIMRMTELNNLRKRKDSFLQRIQFLTAQIKNNDVLNQINEANKIILSSFEMLQLSNDTYNDITKMTINSNEKTVK